MGKSTYSTAKRSGGTGIRVLIVVSSTLRATISTLEYGRARVSLGRIARFSVRSSLSPTSARHEFRSGSSEGKSEQAAAGHDREPEPRRLAAAVPLDRLDLDPRLVRLALLVSLWGYMHR